MSESDSSREEIAQGESLRESANKKVMPAIESERVPSMVQTADGSFAKPSIASDEETEDLSSHLDILVDVQKHAITIQTFSDIPIEDIENDDLNEKFLKLQENSGEALEEFIKENSKEDFENILVEVERQATLKDLSRLLCRDQKEKIRNRISKMLMEQKLISSKVSEAMQMVKLETALRCKDLRLLISENIESHNNAFSVLAEEFEELLSGTFNKMQIKLIKIQKKQTEMLDKLMEEFCKNVEEIIHEKKSEMEQHLNGKDNEIGEVITEVKPTTSDVMNSTKNDIQRQKEAPDVCFIIFMALLLACSIVLPSLFYFL